MTNIDKAEALAALRKHAKGKTVLGGQVYQSLTLETALGAIAALPARGVGVKALDDLERFSAREIAEFADKYEAERAERWLDYQHVYAALAPTDAAPMHDEAPAAIVAEIGNQVHNLGCELQGDEDVSTRLADLASRLWSAAKLCSTEPAPTDAAQAREAHLREAAAAVRARYMGDNNREDQEVLRCEAAILALIGEDRT